MLYGAPAATHDGKRVIVAQAIIWPSVLGTQRGEGPVGFLASHG